jgi:hypothetical protein
MEDNPYAPPKNDRLGKEDFEAIIIQGRKLLKNLEKTKKLYQKLEDFEEYKKSFTITEKRINWMKPIFFIGRQLYKIINTTETGIIEQDIYDKSFKQKIEHLEKEIEYILNLGNKDLEIPFALGGGYYYLSRLYDLLEVLKKTLLNQISKEDKDYKKRENSQKRTDFGLTIKLKENILEITQEIDNLEKELELITS